MWLLVTQKTILQLLEKALLQWEERCLGYQFTNMLMVEDSPEEFTVSFQPNHVSALSECSCEPVCPVYATYHNEEGMNAMVYNRCVR